MNIVACAEGAADIIVVTGVMVALIVLAVATLLLIVKD
jgi:hypothetical protein